MISKENIHVQNLKSRKLAGNIWYSVFLACTALSIIFLSVLIISIINNAFGIVILGSKYDPQQVSPGKPLVDNTAEELQALLKKYSTMDDDFTEAMLRTIDEEKPLSKRSRDDLYRLFVRNVLVPEVILPSSLIESIFKKNEIIKAYEESKGDYPFVSMQFRSWLNPELFIQSQSSDPLASGLRTALMGTFWIIFLTVLFALPLGLMAAVYLELYAKNNLANRIIQVNIYNLAGVPSIIYGLLGLAVFVRTLEPVTSGGFLQFLSDAEKTTQNGRTILSAGLTLAILVLPIIIINTQEAIKAVPSTIVESSFGLGATKWQTIWHHVLPMSMERILTGVILAVSRAVGETAPLVVIGASTFIVVDPTSVFSKFTALPIQIYQWTARPQVEFRNLAAAAIIVLLALLLTMNAAAIFLRNRTGSTRIE